MKSRVPGPESKSGLLLVLSGPSGVGKTTIARRLTERPEFVKITTCTTRAPRGAEVDGRDYHFLSRDQFQERARQGRFLEYAEVHGEFYGTPKDAIESELKAGRNVLLDIDVQGAHSIRRSGFPNLLLFIAPPSWEELRKRIKGRKTESAAAIQRRLQTAEREMKEKDTFDRVIVNRDLEQTVEEVFAAVRGR